MPAVLPQERWDTWLDPNATVPDLRSLMIPYPGDDLEAVRGGWTVNDVRDSPA